MENALCLYRPCCHRHNLVRSFRRPAVQRANLIPGGHQQLQALAVHRLALRGQEYHRVPFHRPACAPENIRLGALNVDLDRVRGFDLTCGKQGVRPRSPQQRPHERVRAGMGPHVSIRAAHCIPGEDLDLPPQPQHSGFSIRSSVETRGSSGKFRASRPESRPAGLAPDRKTGPIILS